MAKATINEKEITETITKKIRDGITLTLSDKEARLLLLITGGLSFYTGFHEADTIYRTLTNVYSQDHPRGIIDGQVPFNIDLINYLNGI